MSKLQSMAIAGRSPPISGSSYANITQQYSKYTSSMRTLFGENILSPGPASSAPEKPNNPFEISFASSSNTTTSSSAAGSSYSTSPPQQIDWLTQNFQDSERQAAAISHRAEQSSAIRHGGSIRRKGVPKVLFMGMRRSGKSSIQKVIFEKLPPAETLYLDSTNQIQSAVMESFIRLESAELPSTLPITSPTFDRDSIFLPAGAVVWVLDMQDDYFHSIAQLIETATFLLDHYPHLAFEVFIHKTDGLSEEYRHDTFRDVRQRVQDELSDAGYGNRGVAFYQTSIFDHSIYEAMSKVAQKLLPSPLLPALEDLLNKLCAHCRIQKAYLFDTVSKLYLATDASPTFLRDYEVCADYVDVVVDIKQIYDWRPKGSREKDEDGSEEEKVAEKEKGKQVGEEAREDSDEKNVLPANDAVGESVITFDKGGDTYMYAREINDYLSLICVMGPGSPARKRPLIDYNVSILHDALVRLFDLTK